MNNLAWRPISPSWFTSNGVRGYYTVRKLNTVTWGLFAVGRDGLAMLDIPVSGRLFHDQDAAKRYVEKLDAMTPAGEMSGS